jgi:hypothetical protein
MWKMLQRHQESLLVATAMTLVMLALLSHGRALGFRNLGIGGLGNNSPDKITASVGPFFSLPTNDAFYADKWRQIASDFYAAHPVLEDNNGDRTLTAALPTIAVSYSKPVASPDESASDGHTEPGASPAAIVSTSERPEPASYASLDPTPTISSTPTISTQTIAQPLGPAAVVAAIAAGMLAFLLFQSIWPPSQTIASKRLIPPRKPSEDELRIELPSEWVRIRPTMKQRSKPMVLSTAYISAAVAAWSIIFLR